MKRGDYHHTSMIAFFHKQMLLISMPVNVHGKQYRSATISSISMTPRVTRTMTTHKNTVTRNSGHNPVTTYPATPSLTPLLMSGNTITMMYRTPATIDNSLSTDRDRSISKSVISILCVALETAKII